MDSCWRLWRLDLIAAGRIWQTIDSVGSVPPSPRHEKFIRRFQRKSPVFGDSSSLRLFPGFGLWIAGGRKQGGSLRDHGSHNIRGERLWVFFSKIKEGLTKTRKAMAETLGNVFSGFSNLDDDFYDELEECLILADLGVETAGRAVESLRRRVKEEKSGSRRRPKRP